MRQSHLIILVVLSVVFAGGLLLGGCGGTGPTLPSPDAGEVAPPPPPPDTTVDIYGRVTDDDHEPLAGVRVDTTDGTRNWTDTTDADGNYRLVDVSAGSRGVSFALAGYATEYAIATVANVDVELNMLMGNRVETNPEVCPVITMNRAGFDEETGLATVSGSVLGIDSDTAILMQNGEASLIGLDLDVEAEAAIGGVDEGTFETTVVLEDGDNDIFIVVANAACTSAGDVLSLPWAPSGASQYYFRATLTWDAGDGSDVDLHCWTPTGEHLGFVDENVAAGDLDVDDIDGWGPENFTCDTMEVGRYRLAVNAYDLNNLEPVTAHIRVIAGSLAANRVVSIRGPYSFSSDYWNLPGDYPTIFPVTNDTEIWWRPCDIILTADGEVQIVAPDNQPLPLTWAAPDSAAAGSSKLQK